MERCIGIISLAMVFFHVYGAAYIVFTPMVQRPIHLGFVLVLIFLTKPFWENLGKDRKIRYLIIDLAFIILSLCSLVYLVLNYREVADPMRQVFPLTIDKLFGVIVIVSILEATRRTYGWSLVIVTLIFLGYYFLGHLLPPPLHHPVYELSQLISIGFLHTEGIFGLPLGVSAVTIVIFLFFAAFLQEFEVGDFLLAICGKYFIKLRGGPAKIAVVASALFGMINGAAAANVASTGSFTIPLMKKCGYRAEFAGAVEATASAGGQIMPPIMGIAAFVMADMIGVPYSQVMIAGILPAFFYFATLFCWIDIECRRMELKTIEKELVPKEFAITSLKATLVKHGYFIVAIALMFYLLIVKSFNPSKAALYPMLFVLFWQGVKHLIQHQGINFLKKLYRGIKNGAKASAGVGVACACAGIILQVIVTTGIGIKFTALSLMLGNNVFLILLLLMVASIILGMGVPTVACYIILAITIAPTLVTLGVPVMAAHFFILYYGVLAAVTPPMAIAAYTAAGIAGSKPLKTGFIALRLATGGMVVPFVFVYNPGIFFQGSAEEIFSSILISCSILGIILLCVYVVSIYVVTRFERYLKRQ